MKFYFKWMATNWITRTPKILCQNFVLRLFWSILLVINFAFSRTLKSWRSNFARTASIAFLCWLSSALATRFLGGSRGAWSSCGGGGCCLLRFTDFHNHRLDFDVWWLISDDRVTRFWRGMMHNEWRRLHEYWLWFDINIRRLRLHNDWRLLIDVNSLLWLFWRFLWRFVWRLRWLVALFLF